MITIVNQAGEEQDIRPYQARIIIPPEKKAEIRLLVEQKERELNACEPTIAPDQSVWYPAEFKELMQSFLVTATYAENLLDAPYRPSEQTIGQMAEFCDSWISLQSGFGEKVNDDMYFFEKTARLGGRIRLNDSQRRRILEVEDYFYQRGEGCYTANPEQLNSDVARYAMLYVKLLSRHRVLGLSTDIDPDRRKNLEGLLAKKPSLMYNNWLGCSAKRAGLALPPFLDDVLNAPIKTWVEQDATALDNAVRFYADTNPIAAIKIKDDYDGFLLGEYVMAQHHLHRLLDPGPEN